MTDYKVDGKPSLFLSEYGSYEENNPLHFLLFYGYGETKRQMIMSQHGILIPIIPFLLSYYVNKKKSFFKILAT